MKNKWLAGFVAGLVALGGAARADVVFYNQTATSGTSTTNGQVLRETGGSAHNGYAQSFVASQTITGKATFGVSLFNLTTQSQSFRLSLFSTLAAGNTTPITGATTTINQSFTANTPVNIQFTTASDISFTNGTTYYLVVDQVPTNNTNLYWQTAVGVSSGGQSEYLTASNVWQNAVPATAGALAGFVSVPEPGTMALGAIASLAGAGGWWSRRKKKVEVKEEVVA